MAVRCRPARTASSDKRHDTFSFPRLGPQWVQHLARDTLPSLEPMLSKQLGTWSPDALRASPSASYPRAALYSAVAAPPPAHSAQWRRADALGPSTTTPPHVPPLHCTALWTTCPGSLACDRTGSHRAPQRVYSWDSMNALNALLRRASIQPFLAAYPLVTHHSSPGASDLAYTYSPRCGWGCRALPILRLALDLTKGGTPSLRPVL